MDFLKKAFLYVVGTVAVLYEETMKAIQEQQEKMEKASAKTKA